MQRFSLLFVAILLTGCAMYQSPRYTWQIDPTTAVVENEFFVASISPTAYNSYGQGYEAFDFRISNKSDEDIEIDWNKTTYIERNQTNGGFMYEGIVYKDRNNPKPPDIVFAHGNFQKVLWPNKLVFFSGRYWLHDEIPGGTSGIYLVTHIKGKEIKEKIVVVMTRTLQ